MLARPERASEKMTSSSPSVATTSAGAADEEGRAVFGALLHEGDDASEPALAASLGCGVPTAVTELHDGDTVLDTARAPAAMCS